MPKSQSQSPENETQKVTRALLSVSDKSGLIEFAKDLAALGVELVASGGTASAIRDAGLPVLDVAELTASPEMLGGRVKTLHPKIHGGILARRALDEDRKDMEANAIRAIDLVVCNLYPFQATVARADVTRAEAVEKIDIGGPSMIRSAAKNHAYVGVLCDPADYASVVGELRDGGGLAPATRRRLALKAFEHTAAYDTAISQWLADNDPEVPAPTFPESLLISLEKTEDLRYGENPHQKAALYGGFLEICELHHGKALSYNNLIDAQAALALIVDFMPAAGAIVGDERAVVAILKHNTPCGVGAGATPLEAYENAFSTDPDSPFGGIIVSNRPFDLALAEKVDEIFTEVLIAPSFTDEALALLEKKKNRRLLSFDRDKIDPSQVEVRRVFGGLLRAGGRSGAGRGDERDPRDGGRADARAATGHGVRVARGEAREEQRHRVRRRGSDAGDRRWGDLAGRCGPCRCGQGGARRLVARGLRARERRVLPVCGRPRDGGRRWRDGGRAAGWLEPRRRGDRGGQPTRRPDAHDRKAAFPALARVGRWHAAQHGRGDRDERGEREGPGRRWGRARACARLEDRAERSADVAPCCAR